MTKSHPLKTISTSREIVLATFFYSLVAAYATWPLVLRPTGGFYGFGNDNWGGIWFIGWLHRAYWGPESTGFTDQLQAPFGFELPDQVIHPYTRLMSFVFGGIDEGLFAFNLQIFISFILAGLTMYLLAKYLTDNIPAALVAGFIFTFSPFHLAVAMQYDLLASIQWVPLYVLATLSLLSNPGWKNCLFLAGSFVLVLFTNYYYAWFLIWVTPFWVLGGIGFKVLRRKPVPDIGRTLALFGLAGLIAAVISLPALAPSLQPVTSGTASVHPITEAIRYSARPWMLFVPPHDNPFVSDELVGWIQSHLFDMANYEQAVYLGYTALAMAAIGLLTRKSDSTRSDIGRWILLIGMTVGLVIMIGPYIPLSRTYWRHWANPELSNYVPSLGSLMFKIAPIFRFFVRAFVVVSVCLAGLAAIGYARIDRKLRGVGPRAVLLTVVLTLVGLEFTNSPPHRFLSDDAPAWVRAVRRLPPRSDIVQYPTAAVHSPRSQYYMFWQREHDRPTTNPYQSPQAMDFLAMVADPNEYSTGEALFNRGIEFAVVHTRLPAPTSPPYQPELPNDSMPQDAGSNNPWFEKYSETKDAVIYRIRPPGG